jgi:competence protein ComEC
VALRVLWPPAFGKEGPLGPDGANEVSLVLEVRYGSFAALLTGDASVAVEEAFLPLLLSPTVQLLKVGHHGSLTSTSPELLARSTPKAAVISVGRRNRYGHPHPGVLRRLEEAGVEVLRTDRSGTLTLRARRDGTFEVRGERGHP